MCKFVCDCRTHSHRISSLPPVALIPISYSDSCSQLKEMNTSLEHRTLELQEMKDSQVSRHKQIQLLSELANPVEHDFTYTFIDKFPGSAPPTKPKEQAIEAKKFRTGEVEHFILSCIFSLATNQTCHIRNLVN